MSDPTFWDDAEKARKISQEATEAKEAYETYTKLFERAEGLKDILDLAMEEDDQSMEPEIAKELNEVKEIMTRRKSNSFCPANMMKTMLSSPSTPVLAAQKPRTGRKC